MIKDKLNLLPNEPGCYLMKNKYDEVIYVGKAKNLKNRVRSYFTGAHNIKTTKLVSEIADFFYVVTNSEQESLILELNLIKQHKPKYNIALMDDKTYPFIELNMEMKPHLNVVRKKNVTGKLFGPYPNVYSARTTASLLNKMFPMDYVDPIPNFYEAIGKKILGEDQYPYEKTIQFITRFLKGDIKEVVNAITEAMHEASEELMFEKALAFREDLKHIQTTTEKQIISLNDFKDRDFIGIAHNKESISIQILMMRQGRIVDQHKVIFSYIDDPYEEAIQYLRQYYEHYAPDELLFSLSYYKENLSDLFNVNVIQPKIGDKKKIMDMATKNARMDLENYYLLHKNKDERIQEVLDDLKTILSIERLRIIEVFDNSQLFGTNPISAMIVVEEGQFNKNKYRKYHLKESEQDDYSGMREVIYRRYYKLLMEKQTMPDLILVDGGKGQVSAALESIHSLGLNIKVAGLKKDNRHQFEALVFDSETKIFNKHEPLYKFLAGISDEIHRFAITFHRSSRKKTMEKSLFDDIEGIGTVRKQRLLKAFKSIDSIRAASIEDITALGIPLSVAQKIKEVIK